jgi:hypothetical protein
MILPMTQSKSPNPNRQASMVMNLQKETKAIKNLTLVQVLEDQAVVDDSLLFDVGSHNSRRRRGRLLLVLLVVDQRLLCLEQLPTSAAALGSGSGGVGASIMAVASAFSRVGFPFLQPTKGTDVVIRKEHCSESGSVSFGASRIQI